MPRNGIKDVFGARCTHEDVMQYERTYSLEVYTIPSVPLFSPFSFLSSPTFLLCLPRGHGH
jgi:hypothetical protein